MPEQRNDVTPGYESGIDASGGRPRDDVEEYLYDFAGLRRRTGKKEIEEPVPEKVKALLDTPGDFHAALHDALAEMDDKAGRSTSSALHGFAAKANFLDGEANKGKNDPTRVGALSGLRTEDDGALKSAAITVGEPALEITYLLADDALEKAKKLAEEASPIIFDFMFGEFGGMLIGALFSSFFDPPAPPLDSEGINESGEFGFKAPADMFTDRLFNAAKLDKLDIRVQEQITFNLDEFGRDVFGPGGSIEETIKKAMGTTEVSETQRHVFAAAIASKVARDIRQGELDDVGRLTTKDGEVYELANKDGLGAFLKAHLPDSFNIETRDTDVAKTREIVEEMFVQSGITPDDFLLMIGARDVEGKDSLDKVKNALDTLEDGGEEGSRELLAIAERMSARLLDDYLELRGLPYEEVDKMKYSIGLGDDDKLIMYKKTEDGQEIDGLRIETPDGESVELTAHQFAVIQDRVQELYLRDQIKEMSDRIDTPEMTDSAMSTWLFGQGDRLDDVMIDDYDMIRQEDVMSNIMTKSYQQTHENYPDALDIEKIYFGDEDGKLYVTFVDKNTDELATVRAADVLSKPKITAIIEEANNGISADEMHYETMKAFLDGAPDLGSLDFMFIDNGVNDAWSEVKEAYEEAREFGVEMKENEDMFADSFATEPENIQKKIEKLRVAQEALLNHHERQAEHTESVEEGYSSALEDAVQQMGKGLSEGESMSDDVEPTSQVERLDLDPDRPIGRSI